MTMSRFMTSIFCDDVRKEEGNKFSYMGVYNGVLFAPAFPLVLPKLCIAMSVHCRGAGQPPNSLVFSLFRDDEILGELPADTTQTAKLIRPDVEIGEDQSLVITAVMQFFPLLINAPCKLKARATCDGEELKGGVLSVELFPTQ
jgi:hypothetical protein